MKGRTLLTLIIVGLLAFLIGWFSHGKLQASNQTKNTQVINGFIDTASQADTVKSNNLAHAISGHFILAESNCAGFNFINKDVVLWTNEIACNDPYTLKFCWLSDSTFMTRTTSRINKNCPPKVEIYKVVSFYRNHLTLKSVRTGWNDANDENLEFIKATN